MKSRESTGSILITFAVCYIILVTVLGGIDTLRNGGTDRIINTGLELFLVALPLLISFKLYVIIYLKDRFKKESDEY